VVGVSISKEFVYRKPKMNATFSLMEKYKRQVLEKEGFKHLIPNLQAYKHVDELQDIHEGDYVRWVHLKRRKLTNGAFLVRLDIRDDGVYLIFKNSFGKIFSVWADECLLFVKLKMNEQLFLKASQWLHDQK